MKRLLYFFCCIALLAGFSAHGQSFDYNKAWKAIDALQAKGRYRTAYNQAAAAYARSRKDHQDAQGIKALLIMGTLRGSFSDNGSLDNLHQLQKEVTQAHGPALSVLQSLLADAYKDYSWRSAGGTTLKEYKKEDVGTWSYNALLAAALQLYKASVQDTGLLQRTPVAAFAPVIVKGNVRALQPTLFDILARRTIEQLQQWPGDRGELVEKQVALYASAATFMHLPLRYQNENLQTVMGLYQQLLRQHQRDGNTGALVAIELARLQAVANWPGSSSLGDSAYRQALLQVVRSYPGIPEAAAGYYQLAVLARRSGQGPQGNLQAKAWCDSAISRYPNSIWTNDCRQLRAALLAPNLDLEMEAVNLPGQPMLALLRYGNLSGAWLRVVQLPDSVLTRLGDVVNRKQFYRVRKLPLLHAWEQRLPTGEDLETHRTEIKIEGLPTGQYALVASMKKDFSLDSNILQVVPFQVSNVSLVQDGDHGYLLHRASGGPLPGGYLVLPAKRRKTAPADASGRLNLAPLRNADDDVEAGLLAVWGKDTLRIVDSYYGRSYRTDISSISPVRQQGSLYTDRAIYRPGQTIYFKGLRMEYDAFTGRFSTPDNTGSPWLYLRDQNDTNVDSLQVHPDDWGNCYGQLKIPANGSPGSYSLYWGDVQTAVRVEEYKRPQFGIILDALTSRPRLGDSVQVTGQVRTFAGANLAGARVVYKVAMRRPYSIYDQGSYLGAAFLEDSVRTDADGRFTCRFVAKAPDTWNSSAYLFTVSATATDATGETHNQLRSYRIGNTCLTFGMQGISAGIQDSGKLAHLAMEMIDQNGVAQPLPLRYTLYSLRTPKALQRTRRWTLPDRFVISAADFHRDFPHDVYDSVEENLQNWPIADTVLADSIQLAAGQELALPAHRITAGAYLLRVFAQTPCGELLADSARFTYYDGVHLPYAMAAFNWLPKTDYTPGDTVQLQYGVSQDSFYLVKTRATITRLQQQAGWHAAGLHTDAIVLPADSLDSQVLDLLFVKDNRLYQWSSTISVTRPVEGLQVSVGTHRDKLLPGEKDRWQIKISGNVPARLTATLYDASLDALAPHEWSVPYPYTSFRPSFAWNFSGFTTEDGRMLNTVPYNTYGPVIFDELGWSGNGADEVLAEDAKGAGSMPVPVAPAAAPFKEKKITAQYSVVARESSGDNRKDTNGLPGAGARDAVRAPEVTPRTNFAETAFFLPNLRTDSSNTVSFDFTMPESLTRWRFMGLAENSRYQFGYTTTNIVTSKPLMVQANAPRFLRQGDTLSFTIRISNTSNEPQQGKATLTLQDAADMANVDEAFYNRKHTVTFNVPAGQTMALHFPIRVPDDFNSALQYKIGAASGNFSDGEQNTLPVLPRKILVKESLPFTITADTVQTYPLPTLARAENVKLQLVSNPSWMAVQALPYLMESTYECAEQSFNRYYANCLGGYIVSSIPAIQKVFEKWQRDSSALQSNLEKHAELKSALLAETPWVLEAKSASEQQAQVASLFNLYELGVNKTSAKAQFSRLQNDDGSFSWFRGMEANSYITRYIVAGLGRLQRIDISGASDAGMRQVAANAVAYLDRHIQTVYNAENPKARNAKIIVPADEEQVHYLYARSFFPGLPYADSTKAAHDFYLAQARRGWLKQSTYYKAMLALVLYRAGDKATANDILVSLKETAIAGNGQGVHWNDMNDMNDGWRWYEAPVETAAQVIEAFSEITRDTVMVNNIKTWLLAQKQTQHWNSTKATADACYALLLQGGNWLTHTPDIRVTIGDETVTASKEDAGMTQRTWAPPAKPLHRITVDAAHTQQQQQPSWGSLYWQYFQDADSVKAATTGITVQSNCTVP